MKKEYIKPEMFVEEIILESSMLAASVVEGDEDLELGAPGLRDDNRRGSWGNLWDQGEE